MYLQLIIIIILILIIIYLYNKQKIESLDFSQGFNKEGITNLLSAYNSIKIEDNNISNNIRGSLKIDGNVNMNTINSNTINIKDLNANNITANEYRIKNIDFNDYKICLQDQSHCIKPYLLNLYSQINSINSPFNNMYLSDASNCVIYEYNAFNLDMYNFGRWINRFGTNNPLLTDTSLTSIKYQTNLTDNIQRVSYLYSPQKDYDVNTGFMIWIPDPSTLTFKCKVVWIEIKSDRRRSFRVTSPFPDTPNNVLDVVYSNYLTYSNSLRPDGADYNMIGSRTLTNNITQWVPIPIDYDSLPYKAIHIRRNRTDTNDANSNLMISGLAFTTNPWNHCKLPAICIHWNLNDSNPNVNKSNPSTTFTSATTATDFNIPFDEFTDYITFHGKLLITRIPVINSGKDKLLYLNVANNLSNLNIQNVLIQTDTTKILGNITPDSNILNSIDEFNAKTITQIENFTTTYDNPFARYFNSHKNNRYIATRIPASLIKSNFIRVILQSQVSTGTGLMIYEIGTHDLLYTEF